MTDVMWTLDAEGCLTMTWLTPRDAAAPVRFSRAAVTTGRRIRASLARRRAEQGGCPP